MRILGVVGSPRTNGNTHVLVSTILEAAAARGAEGELLMLGQMSIAECDGCHVCWSGKACPKDDDMNAVYGKLAACDAVVFGTPVYWYGPTALMKAFIDRFVYFNCPANRPAVAGKPAALAIPFEETDPHMADAVVEFFARCLAYLQMELRGQVIAPGVTLRGEVGKRADILATARGVGEALAAGGGREHARR